MVGRSDIPSGIDDRTQRKQFGGRGVPAARTQVHPIVGPGQRGGFDPPPRDRFGHQVVGHAALSRHHAMPRHARTVMRHDPARGAWPAISGQVAQVAIGDDTTRGYRLNDEEHPLDAVVVDRRGPHRGIVPVAVTRRRVRAWNDAFL